MIRNTVLYVATSMAFLLAADSAGALTCPETACVPGDTIKNARLVSTGPDVHVRINPARSDVANACLRLLYPNAASIGPTATQTSWTPLQANLFSQGSELIFGFTSTSLQQLFMTGPATRNRPTSLDACDQCGSAITNCVGEAIPRYTINFSSTSSNDGGCGDSGVLEVCGNVNLMDDAELGLPPTPPIQQCPPPPQLPFPNPTFAPCTTLTVPTPDTCSPHRAKAWGSYVSCIEAGAALFYAGNPDHEYVDKFKDCRAAYSEAWGEAGCSGPRFEDNGDNTVTDNLSGLTWEKKGIQDGQPDLSAPDSVDIIRDADNVYTWSNGTPWPENGTAFNRFLETLNGASFGGANGWRLPTLAELQTLMNASGTGMLSNFRSLENHEAVFLKGPYWSATSSPRVVGSCTEASQCAWNVMFDPPPGIIPQEGGVMVDGKNGGRHVRAVRGGL